MQLSFKKFLEATETADFKQVVELLAAASEAIRADTPVTEEMLLSFQMAGDILKNSNNDLKGDWLHGFIPALREYADLPEESVEQNDKTIARNSLMQKNLYLNQCITAYQNVGFFGFYVTNQFAPPRVMQEFFIHIPMNPIAKKYPFMPENAEQSVEEAWGATVLVPVDDEVVSSSIDSAMGVNQYSQTVKQTHICTIGRNSLFKPNTYSYINLGRLRGPKATQFRAINPVLDYAADNVPYSGHLNLNDQFLQTGGVLIQGKATNYNIEPAVLDYIEHVLRSSTNYAILNDIEYYAYSYVICRQWENTRSPW